MIVFKDLPVRETASIMKGQFEQIKMLYQNNPELAGELAISMIEQALCLDYSSTDFTIQLILKNYENIVEKKAEKYDAKKLAAIEAQKDALRPIAQMLREGKSQVYISKSLGIPTSTLNDKVRKIRTNFPDLLEIPDPEKSGKFESDLSDSDESGNLSEYPVKKADFEGVKNPENPENPDHVNVNVNVNVNDFSSSHNEEEKEEFSADAENSRVSLTELRNMGARFKWIDGETVRIEDTGKLVKVEVGS